MVFSNILFIFLFLPIVTGIYYLADVRYRNYILLVASILFYSVGEPKFVIVMIFSIIANYYFAIAMDRTTDETVRRIILIFSIVANIGLLFVYKYLDFSIRVINKFLANELPEFGIALPIGISFFTFQAMSYVIDVYKKEVKVQKNLFCVALYISFFPQLIAGPIVRYQTIENQILCRKCNVEKYSEGIRRFVIGLSKKVLIANNMAVMSERAFAPGGIDKNGIMLWIGAICYSLQIYYDFSGYSDMAIGLGKMFGFEFLENFNYPYMATSITDFWRRWHISLSSWFRDYVYIPLGGSRVKSGRHILNMFIVWILTGLWHGANYTFVAWGMWYFVLLVIEKYIIKPEIIMNSCLKCMWRVLSILCVVLGWVIFNSPSLRYGVHYIIGMFGIGNISWFISNEIIREWMNYRWFILAGLLFSTPVATVVENKLRMNSPKNWNTKTINYTETIIVILLFIWSISFMVLGSHNPFIYLNF